MVGSFKNLEELIDYQQSLVDRYLKKLVESETTYNKRALINSKIKLDAYIKAKELLNKTK